MGLLRSFLLLAGVSVLVLSMVACQRDLKPEEGCTFMQNDDVQRISWKASGLPISLYIHDSVPKEAYPSIEEAMATYNRIFKREVFVIRGFGTSGSNEPIRDGKSVIYWMNTWEESRLQEQGRTTVYWSGDKIYEADLRINNSATSQLRFHFTQNSEPIQGVDLKSLFVHEFGHILGLDHNEDEYSIMRRRLAEGITRAEPSQTDINNLTCEYH